MGPCKLLDQIKGWVKAGIKVYSCYEAGVCGYWYHRELIKAGAMNFVVVPRLLENQRTKHQKTDRLDARALLDRLESYLNGNRYAMSIVTVPSLEEEQQRCPWIRQNSLCRNPLVRNSATNRWISCASSPPSLNFLAFAHPSS
jgi:transposase